MISLRKFLIYSGMLSRLVKIFCKISSANLMLSYVTFCIFPVKKLIIVSDGNSYSLISKMSLSDSRELPGISLSLSWTPGSLVHCLRMRSKYTSGLRLEFDYENELSMPPLILRVMTRLFEALATESAVVVKTRPLGSVAMVAISKPAYYYESSVLGSLAAA